MPKTDEFVPKIQLENNKEIMFSEIGRRWRAKYEGGRGGFCRMTSTSGSGHRPAQSPLHQHCKQYLCLANPLCGYRREYHTMETRTQMFKNSCSTKKSRKGRYIYILLLGHSYLAYKYMTITLINTQLKGSSCQWMEVTQECLPWKIDRPSSCRCRVFSLKFFTHEN